MQMFHASRPRSLSGMALEVILGHAGFCFLVRRPLLSVFGKVYALVQAHCCAPARRIFCPSLFLI